MVEPAPTASSPRLPAGTAPGAPGTRSLRAPRAEVAADLLARIADAAGTGARLGSKDELRARCAVSVGTFNEAVRIAQSRGVVSVRPGPGGGLFVADQPPLVRFGNSVLALDGAHQTSVVEAVRIRDALDPLLIEDAVWHASQVDLVDLRRLLGEMARTAQAYDPIGFVHANWQLHARIAEITPQPILKSLYLSLLAIIESHTLDVLPTREQPLPEFIAQRHDIHAAIVDAIAAHDGERALALVHDHNANGAAPHEATRPEVQVSCGP